MYIHAGNNLIINSRDIVGIFDMDNTTVSVRGREFLPRAQEQGKIVNSTDELPASFIVTGKSNGGKIYLSSLSPRVLSSRAKKKSTSIAQSMVSDGREDKSPNAAVRR